MSDKATKPKNPSEWVDNIGLRGAVAHLAEIVYSNSVSGSAPWEELPDNIAKPDGYEIPANEKEGEGNPDPSSWQITRMPDKPKLWQVVDARNMKIAYKFPDIKTAQQYIDWGRANRKSLTADKTKK